MKLHRLFFGCATLATLSLATGAWATPLEIKSFSLSQTATIKYDAAPAGQPKTPAQLAIDWLASVGARHVNLTPEAHMASPTTTQITPLTPAGSERALERDRYLRLMQYIQSKGMTVGLRPIILLDQEASAGGRNWHGNIKPTDPLAWFDSLRAYLDIYANIAKVGHASEFTVGAELYSMTVGLEDQWVQQPYGFPREWTQLIREYKKKLTDVRFMYDINYTDQTARDDGTGASGGELERWRYRLVDLKPDAAKPRTLTPENRAAWEQMRELWDELDMIGIDMYRSLLPRAEIAPQNYDLLVKQLEARASQFASDIDSKLYEIEYALNSHKRVIVKEVGFKSCTGCFTDPFQYDDSRREVNVTHQAAAYQAFMNAFVKAGWTWLAGISWWDVSTDPARSGEKDPGFTPRGKHQTEVVIQNGWN